MSQSGLSGDQCRDGKSHKSRGCPGRPNSRQSEGLSYERPKLWENWNLETLSPWKTKLQETLSNGKTKLQENWISGKLKYWKTKLLLDHVSESPSYMKTKLLVDPFTERQVHKVTRRSSYIKPELQKYQIMGGLNYVLKLTLRSSSQKDQLRESPNYR